MRRHALLLAIPFLLGSWSLAHAQNLPQLSNTPPFAAGDAIIHQSAEGILRVQVVAENIVHVQFAKDPAFFDRPSFAVLPQPPLPASAITHLLSPDNTVSGGNILATQSLQADVHWNDEGASRVTFRDGHATNNVNVLQEVQQPRSFEPAEIEGEKTFHVRQEWLADPDEALYGLGQHQHGHVNIKGLDIDLWQHNTEIAVPFLASSKGYGILWDNASYTKFGDPRDFAPIPADHLLDAQGNPGGFTATAFSDAGMSRQIAQRVEPVIANSPPAAPVAPAAGGNARASNRESAIRWEGQVKTDLAGDYKFQLYANGNSKLWIDGRLLADHWRQNWLPGNDFATLHFDASSLHTIKVEWIKDGGAFCSLTWKTPRIRPHFESSPETTSLWSQAGDGIDYYFIYGGTQPGALDRVIAGYRQLTGQAPMMPRWAFGLWQSRQRYETQQASLDVVREFRRRQIPFDNIVQDWMYWRQNDWGSHEFDPQRFPDPDQWVKDLHALHAHVMISVWGKFYPTTANFKAMNDKGYLYPVNPAERDWVGRGNPYAFYDAFNPAARQMFWDQINAKLFTKGFDAWWLDATEPDLNQPSPATLDRQLRDMGKTAAGPVARVLNAYPLLSSDAVYQGQLAATPDQRVFILTRSGYAGQQRDAAASWSGDISSMWTAMKKQIAAGLGYSISGLPYWSMDAGGFSVPPQFANGGGRAMSPAAQDEWRELNTRWFQFAAFVPLLRVHGESPYREMWQFGEDGDAYQAMLKADRLRYRLLPYIYSLAGDVTQHGGTFMRPLVMDFPNDKAARDITDQFMFGPAVMVSPVTEYKARIRAIYFPKSALWYDFWRGEPEMHGDAEETPPTFNGQQMPLKPGLNYVAAPFSEIPLHIRAGSIIPLGPELQYTGEKPADPLTLLVYTGADADFSLYEDDGLTYQYEHGKFSRIPLHWNERARTLTLGPRDGSFDGMPAERTIRVVFISKAKPVPFAFDLPADKTVQYGGTAMEIAP